MSSAASPTDEELFAAYRAGDPAAFAALFARFGPRLLGLFRRRNASEEDAQELVQQTFLQMHRARHDFRTGARLRPWLFTIAFNLQRDHYRRRGRRRTTSLEGEPAATGESASEALERGEARAALRRALAELPASQREVIELHWMQGLPFPEVARVVGASLSAVKVRAHRGYKRLRARLAGLAGNRPQGGE